MNTTFELTPDIEKSIKSFETNLLNLDTVFDEVAYRREEAINKLDDFLSNITYDSSDDGHKLSAKLSAFMTYDKLLTSKEKNALTRVQTSMKNKEIDTVSDNSKVISELLKSIDLTKIHAPSTNSRSIDESNNIIEERFKETNLEIKIGELKESHDDFEE